MLAQARSGPPTAMLEEREDCAPRLLHADCHMLLTACPLPRQRVTCQGLWRAYHPQCGSRHHCLLKQRPLVLTLPDVRSTLFPVQNYRM